MPHQNTVFRDVVNRLPWAVLDRLVAESKADAGVRRLSTKNQLLAMIFAQLSEARSLRDVEAVLESQASRRYHAGMRPVRRSTLADANLKRPAAVFAGLFAAMVARAGRHLRRTIGESVHLIDSTSMRLNRLSADWSRFSADVCGVKAHIVYDPDAGCPIYAAITPARVNDISAAQAMPIEDGATYVFDLGYYDYGWWARLDAADCRIVTRLKSNTPLAVIETLPVPPDGAILSDRIGHLPRRLARNRRNPMAKPVREVRVRIDTGKVLRILTNDLDAPASEIADLYKRRWAIELFFRWVKQTLKIGHFYGTSENAVRIQIAVALIVFLLIKMAHAAQRAVPSLTTFARLLRANLMHRKRIDRLRRTGPEPDPVPLQNSRQMALLWT
ncbi:MAG: IS4 family transposase [Acetobacteraceae bacterium]